MIKHLILLILAVYIVGCTAYKQNTQKHESGNDEAVLKNYDGKRSVGIDFFASGNEPFWSLDMNSEDSTKIFILSDNYTVKYKTPAPVLDTVSGTIKYVFGEGVILTLKKEKCTDNMSGEIFSFSAAFSILSKTYSGCGKYIIASLNPLLSQQTLRLNDLWALKKFRNREIKPESFKSGVPVLELHLNDGRFLGNAECNSVSGSIDVGDSYIVFSNFTLTRKLCDGDFEIKYVPDLKSIDSWSLDKMQLILKRKGKEILVYKKID